MLHSTPLEASVMWRFMVDNITKLQHLDLGSKLRGHVFLPQPKACHRGGAGELRRVGAHVRRNEADLSRCLEEWKAKDLAGTVSVCDVSDRADREALGGKVRRMVDGKLNILVNNAGVSLLKPALEVTLEECSRLLATNFESCFHLSQKAHPLLKASGRGSIVDISSIATSLGFPSLPIYSATKG